MKRIWIVVVSCLLLWGCASQPETADTQETTAPAIHYDFEQILRADMFPEQDALSAALNETVQITQLHADGQTLRFTLVAPDISQALITWYEANDFDENALNQQILQLLQTPPHTRQFALSYVPHGNTVRISYDEASLEAFGCGLRQFYAYLQSQVYDALGGGENG